MERFASFLADFFLPDSEPLELWAAENLAVYSRLALDNLDQLAAHHRAEADHVAA
ncbi:MAG: hypothetical protein AB8I52_08800 [Candidatus Promineifilaceae bacterium]